MTARFVWYLKSKESGSRGPGFELPPKRALELTIRSAGVLEQWSIGKIIAAHRQAFKMNGPHLAILAFEQLYPPS